MSKEQMAPVPNPEKSKFEEKTATGGVLSREEFENELIKLHAYLLKYCRHQAIKEPNVADIAEDLVQKTLQKAIQAYKSFKGESSIKTWVTRILINLIYDYQRKKASDPLAETRQAHDRYQDYPDRESLIDTMHHKSLNPEEALTKQQEKEIFYDAIKKLPEMQRRALLLRLEGFRFKKIAEELGTTEETAKNAVFRARRSLEKILGKTIPSGLRF